MLASRLGIHGRNRLGGNSLLDCVVFGRVAGASAARYLFDLSMAAASERKCEAKAIADEAAKATSKLPDSSDADYTDVPPEQHKAHPPTTWPRSESGEAKQHRDAAFVAPSDGKGNSALPEVRASEPGLDPRWPPVTEPGDPAPHVIESGAADKHKGAKLLTMEEVAKHNKPDDCWVILNGVAYDVTEARLLRPSSFSHACRSRPPPLVFLVHGRPSGRQEGDHGVRRPRRE